MSQPKRSQEKLHLVVATPGALILIILLAAVSLAGCGGDDATTEAPAPGRGGAAADAQVQAEAKLDPAVPMALAPATEIPATLNDVVLPEGVEPVLFSFTMVELIEADGRSLIVDMLVADSFARRTRGLMYRTRLPANTGMLFAFPARTTSPFWAKDTFLNLDVAFLGEEGIVQEIVQLEAESTELVSAEAEYFYAIEMPRGWLARQGVVVGSRFVVPESVQGLAE